MGSTNDEYEISPLKIVKSEPGDEEDIIAELEVSDEESPSEECGDVTLVELMPSHNFNDHDYFSQREIESNGGSADSLPRLEIVEEPCPLIRFRYLSELQGTPHGPLTGANSKKTSRTFPSVKLHNWVGDAVIRCWLAESGSSTASPHVHDLVARKGKSMIVCEPHCRVVSKSNRYIARFENLVIIRTAKKEGVDKYFKKKIMFESSFTNFDYSYAKPSPRDVVKMRTIFNSMDKNTVCLFFEAVKIVDNRIKRLCCIKSAPIRNLKDPESSELKIVRWSKSEGSCEGSEEMFLFVKKIPKDIRVEFFERDADGNITWMDYGLFTAADIHYDCAIAFHIPKYKRVLKHGEMVEVSFRLYRVGDKAYSNEVPFFYRAPKDHGTKRIKLSNGMDIVLTGLRENSDNPAVTSSSVLEQTSSSNTGKENPMANPPIMPDSTTSSGKELSLSDLKAIKNNKVTIVGLQANGMALANGISNNNLHVLKLKKMPTILKSHSNIILTNSSGRVIHSSPAGSVSTIASLTSPVSHGATTTNGRSNQGSDIKNNRDDAESTSPTAITMSVSSS